MAGFVSQRNGPLAAGLMKGTGWHTLILAGFNPFFFPKKFLTPCARSWRAAYIHLSLTIMAAGSRKPTRRGAGSHERHHIGFPQRRRRQEHAYCATGRAGACARQPRAGHRCGPAGVSYALAFATHAKRPAIGDA